MFKRDAMHPGENQQKQKFEDAKRILGWHNSKEKTWIFWEEIPGLFAIVHFSANRQGAINNHTFQYCYCCLDNESRLELEVSNPTETTQNPDAVFSLLLNKKIVSGPLVKSFIKQFIEKQHGRNKGIIKT